MNITEITNFSTFSFMIYMICAFAIFWISPQKMKTIVLLVLSYVFYGSYHVSHLAILVVTTLLDFYFGQIIYKRRQEGRPFNFFVYVCLATNLGILFFFKYSSFVFPSLTNLTYQSILLPLGLSFFTLQSIGYVLDISRGKLIPETNLITYGVFVSFFPQIIAGPIERAKDILPQYKQSFSFTGIKWQMAFYLFSYGFFKKYIVADNIAYVLSLININENSSVIFKFSTLVFFFIRIYCDFSGYTFMARAIALLFKIDLNENFNFPLFAHSPQDFWDRWHMSLGRWIKNYFYTPMLLFFENSYAAILIVFPIMGLWHGANVNFILWGLSWALLIIFFKKLNFKKASKYHWAKIFFMFNISALLMVFYKANDFSELKTYLSPSSLMNVSGIDPFFQLNSIIFLPAFIILYELILFKKDDQYYLLKKSFVLQIIFYFILIFGYRYYSGVAAQQVFYLQF